MRLTIPCMTCTQELGRLTDTYSNVEMQDDGCYEVTCPRGHTTTTVLQQHKFEVLLHIGAHAILDGYYREAVSTFASSLERFYEFSIRVLLEASTGSDDLFEATWKSVARYSERQVGAFVFLWAAHFKTGPSLLSEDRTRFRNDVVHKGKIPSREQALKYGNDVLGVLVPLMWELKKTFPEQVQNSVARQIKGSLAKAADQSKITVMSSGMIVDLSLGERTLPDTSLEEHLITLKKWKDTFGGA